MEICFTGGKKVCVKHKGFTIETDQPIASGGDGSALNPFDLFFVSLGACAGYYVLSFCQERGLSCEGIKLTLSTQRDPKTKMVTRVDIGIDLPDSFPEKYKAAVVRTAENCTISRHLQQPPEIKVNLLSAEN